MELIEYYYLLLRHKFTIIGLTFLFAVAGVAYALIATPIYQADSKLLFVEDAGMSSMMGGAGGDMMLAAIGKKSDPLMTQIEMLKTRPVLQEVIDTLKLANTEGEAMAPKDLRSILGFSVVTNTNIIRLTCTSPDPILAADILNTLADIFIVVNQNINRQSAAAARAFVDTQVVVQKLVLDSAEGALAEYKLNSGTISLKQETELKITNIATMESELIKVEADIQGLTATISSYQSKVDAPGARNSSRYTQWRAQLEEGERKLASLRGYRNSLRRKVARENQKLKVLPAQEIRFANLLRDQQIAQEIYSSLLENSEQFKIKEAASTSNIHVVEPAIITENPIEPQKKKVVMLALIAGFMLGFGIALLKEYLDDSPRSLDEIRKLLPYSHLGSIPFVKGVEPLFAKNSPETFIAESLRLVHTNLKFSEYNLPTGSALMVTSAMPGEGKSTTAVNLAYTFASLGKKVCVVNLDLRRPSFHKILGETYAQGVTDYLVNEASLVDISHEYAPHFSVISSGTIPPNPTSLIGGERMKSLIAELKSSFDLVIFDTPPVMLVAETLDLARSMDAMIVVVDMAHSSTRALRDMGLLLGDKQLPIAGLVVNKIGKIHGYYSGYGKSNYHDA